MQQENAIENNFSLPQAINTCHQSRTKTLNISTSLSHTKRLDHIIHIALLFSLLLGYNKTLLKKTIVTILKLIRFSSQKKKKNKILFLQLTKNFFNYAHSSLDSHTHKVSKSQQKMENGHNASPFNFCNYFYFF